MPEPRLCACGEPAWVEKLDTESSGDTPGPTVTFLSAMTRENDILTLAKAVGLDAEGACFTCLMADPVTRLGRIARGPS